MFEVDDEVSFAACDRELEAWRRVNINPRDGRTQLSDNEESAFEYGWQMAIDWIKKELGA